MNPVDRLALADLVHRYAAGVDDRRFTEVVDLFACDATLSVPNPPRVLEPVVHRGRAEIANAIGVVAQAERTLHAIVGEIYAAQPQPDRARGRIACIAHHWSHRGEQATADEPLARRVIINVAWHMRYDDEYVRTDAGWRFHSRALTIDAIEIRPARWLRSDGK